MKSLILCTCCAIFLGGTAQAAMFINGSETDAKIHINDSLEPRSLAPGEQWGIPPLSENSTEISMNLFWELPNKQEVPCKPWKQLMLKSQVTFVLTRTEEGYICKGT